MGEKGNYPKLKIKKERKLKKKKKGEALHCT
jgi:hypothetical protein